MLYMTSIVYLHVSTHNNMEHDSIKEMKMKFTIWNENDKFVILFPILSIFLFADDQKFYSVITGSSDSC